LIHSNFVENERDVKLDEDLLFLTKKEFVDEGNSENFEIE
jgi:hypothetical protein